jgi:hypothetical protein
MKEAVDFAEQTNQNILNLDRRLNDIASSSTVATANLSLSVNELYREINMIKTQILEMRQGFSQLRGVIQQMMAPKKVEAPKDTKPVEPPKDTKPVVEPPKEVEAPKTEETPAAPVQ